jgi:hypothetical protein
VKISIAFFAVGSYGPERAKRVDQEKFEKKVE